MLRKEQSNVICFFRPVGDIMPEMLSLLIDLSEMEAFNIYK